MEKIEKRQLERIGEILMSSIDGENGDFGLKSCIESVIFSLCYGTVNCSTVELRAQYLYQKGKQGVFFNDKMFKALNLVEQTIYKIEY